MVLYGKFNMKEFKVNNGFILSENSQLRYNIYCEMVTQYKKKPILNLQIINKLRRQRGANSVKYEYKRTNRSPIMSYAYRPYKISYPYQIQQLVKKKDLLWMRAIRNTPEEISYYKDRR